jgi:uncharacterized DUF497 family protein
MLDFEWDNAKAAANFRKHGVTFEQAAYAFRDSFGIEWVDESAEYGEERLILLGMSGGQILSVVYTERNECIRIISATQGDET